MFGPCFVIQYFTLIVFLVSCGFWWSASHVCTDQFIEIVTGSPLTIQIVSIVSICMVLFIRTKRVYSYFYKSTFG